MSGNARFHDKLHRANHHTAPTGILPDSSHDPIASPEFPFLGTFSLSGSLSSSDAALFNSLDVITHTSIGGNLSVRGDTTTLDTRVDVTSSMYIKGPLYLYDLGAVATDGLNLANNGPLTLTLNFGQGVFINPSLNVGQVISTQTFYGENVVVTSAYTSNLTVTTSANAAHIFSPDAVFTNVHVLCTVRVDDSLSASNSITTKSARSIDLITTNALINTLNVTTSASIPVLSASSAVFTNTRTLSTAVVDGKLGVGISTPQAAVHIVGDVLVYGTLSSNGDSYFRNTLFTTTSALSIINTGTGAALTVSQEGDQPIVALYDHESTISLFADGSVDRPGWVGVKTSTPNVELTVKGNVSASGNIYGTIPGFSNIQTTSAAWANTYVVVSSTSGSWNSNYSTTSSNSGRWENNYNTTQTSSANWNDTRSTLQSSSANWNDTRSTLQSNSARWVNNYNTTQTSSANWNDTRSTLQSSSARWDTNFTYLAFNSSNWDSAYTTVLEASAIWNMGGSGGGAATEVEALVNGLSAYWETTHSTVSANSATWNYTSSIVNGFLGGGISTGDAAIELGSQRTGNGNAYIDFHSSAGSDYDARIGKDATVNGNFGMYNNGSGNMVFLHQGTGAFYFATGSTPTTRMWIGSAGNVGIGTTAPQSRLDLGAGVLAGVANIRGFSNSGAYTIWGGLGTNSSIDGGYVQLYGSTHSTAPNVITFGIGSSGETMRINSSGNVGIGTNNPAAKLEVSGGNARVTNSAWPSLTLNSTKGTGWKSSLFFTSNGTDKYQIGVDISDSGNNNLFFWDSVASTERMRIDSSGNVGIGTNAPGAKLHVVGAANTALLESSGQEAALDFKNTGSTGRQWRLGTGSTAGGFANGAFGVYDATANAMRMLFDSSGNVGIGTSTPGTKLEVTGQIQGTAAVGGIVANAPASNQTSILLQRSWAPTDQKLWEFAHLAANGTFVLRSVNDAYTTEDDAITISRQVTGIGINSIAFGTNFGTRMTITSAGNVGIGTSSPTQKLEVSGTIKADSIALASASVQTFTTPVTASGDFLVISINGTNRKIQLWD